MAVKASQTITLVDVSDGLAVTSLTLYFKTVNAGSSAPAKPTTATPSGWSTSEPSFDSSKDLYATLKTLYADNTFDYSNPQKYASYEAAKTAYNAASAASSAAALADKIIISDTEPGVADHSKIWYDTTNGKFKQWNDTLETWEIIHDYSNAINDAADLIERTYDPTVTLANTLNKMLAALNNTVLGQNIVVSDTAPTSSEDKLKFWLNTNDETLNKWNSTTSSWEPVAPSSILTSITTHTSDIKALQDKIVFDFASETAKQAFKDNWESAYNTTEKFNQRFVFNEYGLTISSSESTTYKLRLTNEDIKILANDVEVTWWNASGFNCPVVTTESVILRRKNFEANESRYSFRFVYNTNGSVSFRKVVES